MAAASPWWLDDGLPWLVERLVHRAAPGPRVERPTQRGPGRVTRRADARDVRVVLGRRGLRALRPRSRRRPIARRPRPPAGNVASGPWQRVRALRRAAAAASGAH